MAAGLTREQLKAAMETLERKLVVAKEQSQQKMRHIEELYESGQMSKDQARMEAKLIRQKYSIMVDAVKMESKKLQASVLM